MAGRVAAGVKWYLRREAMHPLYMVLAVLPAILLLPAVGSREFSNYLMVFTDMLFTPLAALVAAMHVVREPKVTLFELTLLKSLRVVFTSRLTAYAMIMSVALAPTAAVVAYAGLWGEYAIPLAHKLLLFTAVTATATLIDDSRSSLTYLITTLLILPYSTPLLLNRVAQTGAHADPATSTLCYILTPITTATLHKTLSLPLNTLQTIATATYATIITAAYLAFTRKEIPP